MTIYGKLINFTNVPIIRKKLGLENVPPFGPPSLADQTLLFHINNHIVGLFVGPGLIVNGDTLEAHPTDVDFDRILTDGDDVLVGAGNVLVGP